MQIDPMILGKHLHQAAVEQLVETLGREGYSIEREPQIGKAPQARPDLVARRGDETIVYEVKVVGDGSDRDVESIVRIARDLNAQFRMVVVRPQREMGIKVEAANDLLMQALSKSGMEVPLKLRANVQVQKIDDVDFDTVSLHDNDIELRGAAVAIIASRTSGRENEAEQLALPFRFTLLLDNSQHLKGEPKIEWDTSDWDDLVDA